MCTHYTSLFFKSLISVFGCTIYLNIYYVVYLDLFLVVHKKLNLLDVLYKKKNSTKKCLLK